MIDSTTKPKRTRKPATVLGAKQTARVASKRIIKNQVAKTNLHPAAKLVLVAGIGALVSYFLNKKWITHQTTHGYKP